MKIITCRRFEFSAARRLAGRTEGHNFILWVGVTGPLQADTGMVMNIADLKATVEGILERYDHRQLNAQLELEPTTLNTARALWADLRVHLPLDSVELTEEGGMPPK